MNTRSQPKLRSIQERETPVLSVYEVRESISSCSSASSVYLKTVQLKNANGKISPSSSLQSTDSTILPSLHEENSSSTQAIQTSPKAKQRGPFSLSKVLVIIAMIFLGICAVGVGITAVMLIVLRPTTTTIITTTTTSTTSTTSSTSTTSTSTTSTTSTTNAVCSTMPNTWYTTSATIPGQYNIPTHISSQQFFLNLRQILNDNGCLITNVNVPETIVFNRIVQKLTSVFESNILLAHTNTIENARVIISGSQSSIGLLSSRTEAIQQAEMFQLKTHLEFNLSNLISRAYRGLICNERLNEIKEI
ncbi:unnamed protein product [Adineta ricciae]|uniref:Uncharacterized protein n=1 Tax=Adineta ricciae TaxID=249248 RepID=A0A815G3Y9_ADIRI|nr:unnamed protein product [Adineta ricciae]